MRYFNKFLLLSLLVSMPFAVLAQDVSQLHGRVQVVDSFADYKVKVVNSFEDLQVEAVESFPTSPGKWQFVDSFPDFTITFVDSFPDFTIRYVGFLPRAHNTMSVDFRAAKPALISSSF